MTRAGDAVALLVGTAPALVVTRFAPVAVVGAGAGPSAVLRVRALRDGARGALGATVGGGGTAHGTPAGGRVRPGLRAVVPVHLVVDFVPDCVDDAPVGCAGTVVPMQLGPEKRFPRDRPTTGVRQPDTGSLTCRRRGQVSEGRTCRFPARRQGDGRRRRSAAVLARRAPAPEVKAAPCLELIGLALCGGARGCTWLQRSKRLEGRSARVFKRRCKQGFAQKAAVNTWRQRLSGQRSAQAWARQARDKCTHQWLLKGWR